VASSKAKTELLVWLTVQSHFPPASIFSIFNEHDPEIDILPNEVNAPQTLIKGRPVHMQKQIISIAHFDI
jgi:hypothetical protein